MPQLPGPWSRQLPAGSGFPVWTLLQVPSVPLSAQDLHAAVQAVSQQTPWAQKPLPHSPAFEQEAPFDFLPHELPLQTNGVRHCVLVVQALKQALPLQTYGLQGRASGATQWPVALQVDGGV